MRFSLTCSRLSRRFAVLLLAAGFLGAVGVPVAARAEMVAVVAAQANDEGSTPVNNVPEKKEEVHDENYEYTHSDAVRALQEARPSGLYPTNRQRLTALQRCFLLLIDSCLDVPKAFRNRSTGIQTDLVDARTATEEAKARLDAVEARLSKLDADCRHAQAVGTG